jgi:hypothetical protein
METRTVSSLPTAAPNHDAVRCLLAIELSKASWILPYTRRFRRRSAGTRWKDAIGRAFLN